MPPQNVSIFCLFLDKMAAPDLELKKAFGELQAKMIDTKQVPYKSWTAFLLKRVTLTFIWGLIWFKGEGSAKIGSLSLKC